MAVVVMHKSASFTSDYEWYKGRFVCRRNWRRLAAEWWQSQPANQYETPLRVAVGVAVGDPIGCYQWPIMTSHHSRQPTTSKLSFGYLLLLRLLMWYLPSKKLRDYSFPKWKEAGPSHLQWRQQQKMQYKSSWYYVISVDNTGDDCDAPLDNIAAVNWYHIVTSADRTSSMSFTLQKALRVQNRTQQQLRIQQ